MERSEAKSQATLRARGFDFAFASRIFDSRTYERVDDRRDYGEERYRAIGVVDGRYLFVVFTWRGRTRRIISARDASGKERDAYRAIYG